MKKTYINWSGGKDSALALYKSIDSGVEVSALLTSINKTYDRISMHGVRTSLLQQQTEALNLPLYKVELPEQPGMADYELMMKNAVNHLKQLDYDTAIFGDIFLEDLKLYREKQLTGLGISCSFPLWKIDTRQLLTEFLELGFKTIVVCVNEKFLDKSFCGRIIDQQFINELPAGVDVCGENGEFHTFVFAGPLFKQPIQFIKGEITYRKYAAPKSNDNCFTDSPVDDYGFYFCDLLPA